MNGWTDDVKPHCTGQKAIKNNTMLSFQGIKMKFSSYSGKISQRIVIPLLIFSPLHVLAADNWSYEQKRDNLSNLNYSFAKSPLPPRALYDNIRMELVCKNNVLQAVVDAGSLITSQGRSFKFEYQIDNNAPVNIEMKTFKDSKRRGYTEEHAKRIAADMLTGQSIFIRASTLLGSVLSGKISLENAGEPIQRVLSDCAITPSASEPGEQPAYTLTDFEADFNKLTPEQQQQVLDRINKIMMEIR